MKKISAVFLVLICMMLYVVAQTPQASVKASVSRGEKVYKQYCLACHQPDGEGVPRMNPPLIATSYVTGNKKKIIDWVLKGSVKNIPIDDKTYSNNMPAQDYLKDQEIADVLTYIRKSFGNNAGAILPADVKAVRATMPAK